MAKRGKLIREKAFSVAMAAMLAFSMTPTAAFAAGSGSDDPFENAKAPAQAQEQPASPTTSEGAPSPTPAQSASPGESVQLTAAPLPAEEPEHVKVAFDANAKDATGKMDDFEVVLDGKQRKLPACAFEREGYDFAGWSTTADGEDVKDDPDTKDVDESFKASFVPEGQKLEDLGYSYEKEGADGKAETVNADLTYAVKDGKVTLYAQWKELPKAEEAAAKPDEATSKPDEATAPKDAQADSAKGEDGDAPKDAPADTAQKPSDTPAKPDAEAKQAEPEATAAVDGELLGVTVSDAPDEGAAEGALEEAGLEAPVAKQAARQLFAAPAKAGASDDMPWEADGSSVTALDAKWITEDTVDNNDKDLLYLKPAADEVQEARLRISYSMSGEKDYEPGDVVITIPASMFCDRDGNVIGKLIVPYPEEPGTKGAFNWKQVGDTVQIVNTKRMKAATQGFLDIAFTDLTPHVIKDMQRHEWTGATIEVTTWAGNVIGKRSNHLYCEIDTAAEVQSASKERSGTIDVVTAASVPDSAKVEGEDEYVRVHWYTWAYVNANQTFDLDYVDTVTDAYESATDGHDGDDVKVKSGEVYDRAYTNGRTRYDHFYVYYPFSQFEPDTDYTFTNSVTYTLTETDPEIGSDPRQVTSQTATAQAIWNYHLPEFKVPTGHFMVYKMGNDGDTWGGKQNASHKNWEAHRLNWSERPDYTTDYTSYWYGVYPNALNKLRQGEDVEIGYTSQAVGYLLPWTLAEGADTRLAESYNQRSVTMTVEEDGLDNLTVGEDYDWTAVDFGIDPWIAKLKAINVNPDGSFTAVSAGDGTFEYQTDYDKSKIPQIVLSIERNGEWEDYATVDYTSGTCVATLADGTVVEGTKVPLPEHVTDLRVSATTNVAALIYRFRPMATLHASSEKVQAITDFAFANGRVPTYIQYNQLHMTAERADTHEEIVRLERFRGYDQLMGYTTDVSIVPSKSSVQGISDIDYDEGTVKVHYAAVAEERTTITDLGTYKQALEDGAILKETHGVWRDLLPKGMVPDVASVRLRSGDKVERVYTLEDYKGSGRTLLVVEATLQNAPQQYTDKGLRYWEDVPSIRFDATYSLENVINYGDELHNVISFESGNPSIGTVRDYSGEPDNPRSSNNVATRNAFADDAERDAMTDLDKSSDKPAFVYAGTWTNLDLLGRGTTSLSKEVDVNNEGTFTTGVHYGHPEEYPAGEARTVYEGGQYTYRLTMMSNVGTTSKDMILYDTLENFHAGQGNDEVDIDAPRWQGTLRKVDVSQLKAIGVAPVVYYATEAEMPLEDADEHEVNSLETAPDKWVRADAYTGSMSDVKAIAVDLRKKADGSDFELPEGESVVVLIQMKAPWGDEVRQYIADDAHAYNNAFLKATSVDNETFAEDTKWIRKDYVKVGIAEMNIDVEKKWEDDGDRDGVRPESVTMHLYAGDVDTGRTVVLDEGNGWKAAFEHVPYTDEDGEKVIYSVREDVPGGYESSVDSVGTQAVVTNSHDVEKVHLSGKKRWVGDDGVEGARPQSILVTLYADGQRVADRTVHDEGGTWKYDFGELPKYRDGGTEIVYTVSELRTKALESYVMETDGVDVVNTYHPYGELTVAKHVTGATPSVAGKRFAFTFSFADGDGEPLFDEFDYDVVDADGNVIAGRSGKVKTDGVVELADGERAVVHEIPQGTTYTVTEAAYDGWTVTRKSGDTGTVKPNDVVSAEFENSYKTEGMAQLQATKSLTGRDMMRYQFRFEVYDVTGLTGAERETGGELVRAATNAADGTVTFGALRYGNADDGKTYTYRVQETDRGKPGYTYDGHVAYVSVAVSDDGDGTMTITPTTEGGVETVYVPATVDEAVSGDVELFGLVGDTYKALVHRSVDGTETWGYMSGSDFSLYDLTKGVFKAVERTAMHFENAYHAEGSVDLKCWKQLEGRNLADGEFSFELVELDKDANVVEGGVHQVKHNDANGEVAWDAISYDQDDAGKTFYYRMTEVAGDDATVTYDGSSKIMSVTVVDNGDGTLSCSTGTAKLVPHAKDGADLTVRGIAQVCSHLNDDNNYLTIPSNPPISNDLRWANAGLDNSGYYSDARRKFEVASSQSDVDLFDTIWDMDYFPKVNKTWTGEDAMTVLSTLAKHFNGGNEPESALKFIDTDAVYKTNWYDTLGSNGEWENIWTRAHAYKAYGFGFDAVDPNGADSAGVYCCSYMFKVDASELTYTVEATEAEVPIFKNTLKPGDLVVQKRVTDDSTGYPEDQTFKFRVELGDPSTEMVDGMVEATKVSHTNNMGDDGVATRMLNSYETKTDTVTLPGAEQLQVDVWFSTYNTNYAWLAIYGADQTPTTSNYNSAAVSQGKLGGGASYGSYARPTSASRHRTYTVDGDTVKFYFRCNGSGSSYCSGYGYYATVTGMVPGEVEAPTGGSVEIDPDAIEFSSIPTAMVTPIDLGGAWESFCGFLDDVNPFKVEKAYAASGDIASGNYDGVDWRITTDGDLIIGKEGETQRFAYRESRTYEDYPWHEYDSKIARILFDGSVEGDGSMRQMFTGTHAATVDLEHFDTSDVTDMASMFAGQVRMKSINFGDKFDTSKVTDMSYMFSYCNTLTSLDLSDFDTSNVTNMNSMFYNCNALTSLDLGDKFDTSKVTNMNYMFSYCNALTSLDLGDKFDTSNVTDMNSMFSGCNALISLDLGDKFDTSKVTNMNYMFSYCNALTSLDLGDNFDTSSVSNMGYMFSSCNTLISLDLGDKFDTSNVMNMYSMFSYCNALTSLDLGDEFDTSKVTDMSSMFNGCNALTSLDLGDKFDTSKVTNMNYMFNNCNALTSLNLGDEFDTSKVTDMGYMFSSCYALTPLDLGDKFDTSNVSYMSYMFSECKALTSLDLGDKFDTSKVTNMGYMFYSCYALTSLDLGDKFDTSKVTNMPYMFGNCKALASLDLGDKFDTSNAMYMNYMFSDCKALASIRIAPTFKFKGKNITNVSYQAVLPTPPSIAPNTGKWEHSDGAYGPYTPQELRDNYNSSMAGTWVWEKSEDQSSQDIVASGNYDGVDWRITAGGELVIGNVGETQEFADRQNRNASDYPWLGYSNYSSVRFEGDVKGQGNMSCMFSGCSGLLSADFENFDTFNVTNMGSMFYNCNALTSLDLGDKFDTSNVTNMYNMFYNCNALTSLDLGDKFDTSNVMNMYNMFHNCNALTSLDLGDKFDTSKVTDMNSMFSGCKALTSLDLGDKFDTSKVTNMGYMFSDCYALTSLDLGDKFDTSSVPSMHYMFGCCYALTSLDFGDKFDTSNVTNMGYMFYSCYALTSLDLGDKFDTSKVTGMDYMFYDCKALTSLDFGDKFDTSNVTSMYDMFYGCKALTFLDLGDKFDTSNVTTMCNMFGDCYALTSLDLGDKFDTSNVTNMYSMFYNCRALMSLNLGDKFDTSNVTSMGYMFSGCTSLDCLDLSMFDTSKVTNMGYMIPSYASRLVFGPKWQFKGGGSTDYGLNGSGFWYHVGGQEDPMTAGELASSFNSDSAGTWVWLGLHHITQVSYDVNGGMLEGPRRVESADKDPSFTLPEPTRPGFEFAGWTLASDGGGEVLQAGSEYKPVYGSATTLHAKWVKDNYVGYTVRNYLEKADGDGYELAETISYAKMGEPGSSVEVTPRVITGYKTPEAQTVELAADGSATVDFHYDRNRYNVFFDPNGADMGWMDPIGGVAGGTAFDLPANLFSWLGHVFLGWNTKADGTGDGYTDGERVNNLGEDGEDVNLYARWTEAEPEPASTTGEYTVRLKGGQSVEFIGLPHGTEYTIEEMNAPAGWEQESAEGTSGAIVVNETQQARVTNRYSTSGEATVTVRKSFEDGKLDEGAFSFELVDETGKVVSTASNGVPGPDGIATVEFDPIQYNAEGVYHYTVREVKGADARVDYDESIVDVMVLVKDVGYGNLVTSVEYVRGDDLFENSIGTGELAVSKATEGATAVSALQKFAFDVELTGADGRPLDGEAYSLEGSSAAVGGTDSSADACAAETGAKVTFDANGGAFSGQHEINVVNVDGKMLKGIWHTDNIGDDGVKVEDFPSSKVYTGVVTVPGAESLTLDFDYTNVRGNFWVWEGAHPEVATQTYSSDFNPNTTAFSVNYTNNDDDNVLLHGSRTISGDTFTVLYQCYAFSPSSCPSNNGGYNEYTNYGCFIRAHYGDRVVTGTYEEPAGALGMRFAGWYTDEACTEGHEFDFENYDSANGDITVYAKWVPYEGTVDAGHVTFELQGGQSATLAGLPDGTTYKVTERDVPSGWEQVTSDGATGSVEVAKTASATVTNRYSTSGVWTPKATKSLTGADLADGQYAFELVDGSGTVVTTGTNAADGTVTFGPVLYTGADHGKTYTYTMREVAGGEGNTAYDSHEATVIVKPVDNGDGTMTVMASYDGGTTFDGEVGAVPPEFSNEKLPDVKSVAVAKSWKEHGHAVPWPEGVEVTAVLYADGTEVSRATLTAEAPTATFSNLPAKDGERDIVYTVDEVVPEDAQWEKASVTSAGGDESLERWSIVNNAYAPVDVPLTGREGIVWAVWLALAAAGAVGWTVSGMKKRKAAEGGNDEGEVA